MKYLLTLLLLSISIVLHSQSYDTPPKLAFLMYEGRPTMAFLSDEGHGILEYGDTISYKPYNGKVYQYIFTKNEKVNIEEMYESLHIPYEIVPNIKLGGVEYIAINSTKYKYTGFQMGLQAEQAKAALK